MDQLTRLLNLIPWWVWLLLVAAFVLYTLVLIVSPSASNPGRTRQGPESTAAQERETSSKWATKRDLQPLIVKGARRAEPRRQRLGFLGKDLIQTDICASVMVVAPTDSGKTAGNVVPDILDHVGPAVITSVKTDVKDLTQFWRAQQGPVWTFDPSESSGPTVRWSPLSGVHTWADAIEATRWLQNSSKLEKRGMEDREFWDANARKVLAPLLLLAAKRGGTMRQVVHWGNQLRTLEHTLSEQIHELGVPEAFDYFTAYRGLADRTKSSVDGTLFIVLEAWGHPSIQDAVDITAQDDTDVLNLATIFEENGTLYLVAPMYEQELFTPIFETLVSAVWREAQRRYATSGVIDPPLALTLDEAANIAPLRDLDKIASTGRGMGVKLKSVWQDEAQVINIYGPERARTIYSNHTNKQFLGGISDDQTLERVSRLIGKATVERLQHSNDRTGRTTVSTSTTDITLAPPEWIRQLPTGQALVIVKNFKPMHLTTQPWYLDPDQRARIDPTIAAAFDNYYATAPKRRAKTRS